MTKRRKDMALREHAAGVTGQGARKEGKTKTLNYKDPSASKCTAKKSVSSLDTHF